MTFFLAKEVLCGMFHVVLTCCFKNQKEDTSKPLGLQCHSCHAVFQSCCFPPPLKTSGDMHHFMLLVLMPCGMLVTMLSAF